MLRRPLEPAEYTSIRYTTRLVEAGLNASIGTVGDSYDNALAESVNGLYKAELVYWEGPGEAPTTSSSPPSAGSTGSTTPASTPRSATRRQQRLRRSTTVTPTPSSNHSRQN